MAYRSKCHTERKPEILVLYRKREDGRTAHEHGVFARSRYNDLKEDAGVCGGCGLMGMGDFMWSSR